MTHSPKCVAFFGACIIIWTYPQFYQANTDKKVINYGTSDSGSCFFHQKGRHRQRNQQAAAILADARKQADAIIADAKSQADKLRDDAKAEIEVFKNSAQLSAQQAKRDAVLAFRQEVQQEFEKILAADVGKALDQQTLAKLIQAALQGEDVSGYAVEVGQVTDGIRQQLAQELKNGLELRPSKKVGAGFRLAAKDGSGYFDCSDQEIAEMLMPFFRDMHL